MILAAAILFAMGANARSRLVGATCLSAGFGIVLGELVYYAWGLF